jgi:hypothetical protein
MDYDDDHVKTRNYFCDNGGNDCFSQYHEEDLNNKINNKINNNSSSFATTITTATTATTSPPLSDDVTAADHGECGEDKSFYE